ncbi:hypothetical protein NDU88_006812 [Pleurodeles waltl]|uniref:Uncharacterized protein n=1 Tax=Pleurodeles waltl TaxID=8319 RepID=A0AAV7SQM4_PLEWA|nr:hypothetical protein NDU88_006812 [Pleurodeles waltl]
MMGHICNRLDCLPNGVFLCVLPLQVSVHQKKGIWCTIAKEVWTLGVYGRRSTHCRKQWEDLRRWVGKTAEAQLGMVSQRGRGACRTLIPLMACILAVAYPELDGCLRASQQATRGERSNSSGPDRALKINLRRLPKFSTGAPSAAPRVPQPLHCGRKTSHSGFLTAKGDQVQWGGGNRWVRRCASELRLVRSSRRGGASSPPQLRPSATPHTAASPLEIGRWRRRLLVASTNSSASRLGGHGVVRPTQS